MNLDFNITFLIKVTVLGIWPPPEKLPPNYRYIHVELSDESTAILEEMKLNLLQSSETQNRPMFQFPRMMRDIFKMLSDVLDSPTIERLKREERFDLIVFGFFFNDFQLGIAAHFQCPSVIISGTPVTQTMRNIIGNPSMPAIVASPLLSASGGMTFTQRILNHIVLGIEEVMFSAIDRFVYEPTYRQHFPADRYPSFDETKKNVSLILVSTHFSQSDPMPTFPGLIEVSGIQIKKKPDPLPVTIQSWLDDAQNGVIFLSFGSNTPKCNQKSCKFFSTYLDV